MTSFYSTFLILCCLCTAISVNVSTIGPRIVGGNAATKGQFPYQAGLTYSNSFRCGGTIVNLRHVITAGHCVVDDKNKILSARNFKVIVGHISIRYGESHKIEKIHLHNNYSTKPMISDIAVLRIKGKFTFNQFVSAAALPQNGYRVNDSCIISGWGSIRYGGGVSNELRYTSVPIVQANVCIKWIGIQFMSSDMLCAGYYEGGQDACQGDSGGPLLCNNTLTGVVSHGYKCAVARNPGIYTDVHFHIKWISDTLKASATGIVSLVPLMFTTIIFILFSII